MANNTVTPKADIVSTMGSMTVPVPFSDPSGLAIVLAQIIASSDNSIPAVKSGTATEFTTGQWNHNTPSSYVAAPYTIPVLQQRGFNTPNDVNVVLSPVLIYNIGGAANRIAQNFPIKIYPTNYEMPDGTIVPPMNEGQRVVVKIWKNSGVTIDWANSNVINPGMTDSAISGATELIFVITRTDSVNRITDWILPDYFTGSLAALNAKITERSSFAAIINQLYGLIPQLPDSTPPTGLAGGDLKDFYPNPTIRDRVITAMKMAIGAASENVGQVTGDVEGYLPTLTVGNGKITYQKLAPGAASANLGNLTDGDISGNWPTLSLRYPNASGDLSGRWPSLTIKDNTITPDKMAASTGLKGVSFAYGRYSFPAISNTTTSYNKTTTGSYVWGIPGNVNPSCTLTYSNTGDQCYFRLDFNSTSSKPWPASPVLNAIMSYTGNWRNSVSIPLSYAGSGNPSWEANVLWSELFGPNGAIGGVQMTANSCSISIEGLFAHKL